MCCIESICTIPQSTVTLFLKHKPCRVSCQQSFNDRMISTNIWILVAAKLKRPRKLQETHVWGNPYKAPIVLLREVYRFCCCWTTHIFSVDLPVLVQDLCKFQKHCCLRASRMYCNVCFLVKLQLVKEVYNLSFFHMNFIITNIQLY